MQGFRASRLAHAPAQTTGRKGVALSLSPARARLRRGGDEAATCARNAACTRTTASSSGQEVAAPAALPCQRANTGMGRTRILRSSDSALACLFQIWKSNLEVIDLNSKFDSVFAEFGGGKFQPPCCPLSQPMPRAAAEREPHRRRLPVAAVALLVLLCVASAQEPLQLEQVCHPPGI